ncbi:MAG: hypothetical protein DWQ04_24735 [Chloroflexi bacterium]|nr:MAG: hypothetical protein DWQ04_24735 [Chloroflexota bacterium]
MRDKRFITEHRGGPLSFQKHRMLAAWAADCAEHVLPLFSNQHPNDNRPWIAIEAARAWSLGEITVGEARKVSIEAHAAARESDGNAAQFAARAAGHAAGTAHMADHAPGAAMYAIKAIKATTNKQTEEAAIKQEHRWQVEHLPEEIQALILSTFEKKYAFLGL